MSLADEFFFAAHDVGTGKLRLNARVAGVGLAGALLGGLVMHGSMHIVSGNVVLDGAPPDDELGFQTYRQLAADQQVRPLRTWLAYLALDAIDRVGVHMERAGKLELVKRRRVLGSAVRYVPTDTQEAVWPGDRLYGLVRRGEAFGFHDAMLAGLFLVTGLTKHVWIDPDAVTLRRIAAETASLPMSLRDVLSHTEAAVGEITLSPHR